MADKLSRRTLMRGAVGSALVTAAAPIVMAQGTPTPEAPGLDQRLDEAEKKLAHPLAPEVKKLARTQLKNLEAEAADRLKTKLPENSEPCFTYIATEYKR
jgi:hypothetical protein